VQFITVLIGNISFKILRSIIFAVFGVCYQFPGYNTKFCYTISLVSALYLTLCLFVNTQSGFLPMRTENATGNYKFCNRDDSELERGIFNRQQTLVLRLESYVLHTGM
jgi:hypothetical protein